MDRFAEQVRLALTERVLGEVTRALTAAAIPYVVVKGAATRYFLYESPLDRPARDIDLRVAPANIARAERTLERLPTWVFRGAERTYSNFQGSVHGIHVDVESHIFAPYFCALTIDDVLARSQRLEVLHVGPIAVPEVHDHALITIVNVFKDKLYLASARSFDDLQRFPNDPQFGWDELAVHANRARLSTCARVVARHMSAVRGDPRWAWLLRRTTAQRPVFEVTCPRIFERSPTSFASRVLARAGADQPMAQRSAALLVGAAREVEARVYAHGPMAGG